MRKLTIALFTALIALFVVGCGDPGDMDDGMEGMQQDQDMQQDMQQQQEGMGADDAMGGQEQDGAYGEPDDGGEQDGQDW